jgi:cyclic pyranopterin phosphate synthase
VDDFGIDSHKLHLHPHRVAQWLDADTWEKAKKVYPLYWEITTSAACNHRCTFCSTDAIGYPAILMESQILKERMREAKQLGVKSVMFGGTGEPLVHKNISAIAKNAWEWGLDVAFTTNGVLLHKLVPADVCTWIKVSLNAGSRESYAAIHRTDAKDWDKVWANLRDLVKRKGKCTVGVQCVVLPENYQEMRNLALLCIDAGVDYLVLKPYSQATFMLSHQYENVDYSAMRGELKEVVKLSTKAFRVIYRGNAISEEITKQHTYDKCRATPNFWVYTMADGRVFTCSAHLLDERFCIGNLNENTFQEIWEGEKRRENWEEMQGFDIKQCRLNCRMNGPNKYLHQIKHQSHINFI